MEYTQLDEEGQIAAVQALVPGILAQYGLTASSIENVNHSFNSSFKITTEQGKDLALRINLSSGKSRNEVTAEMQWLEQLAQEQVIHGPIPLRTTSDELLTTTYFEPLQADFNAVLYEWIEGEEVGDEPTKEQLFGLGVEMAKLHEHAKTLSFQEPAFLPKVNSTMMNSVDVLTTGQPKEINDKLHSDLLKALAITDEVYSRLSSQQELLPIHADLHMGNVLQTKTGLAIIDFDDAGLGLPVQDLAISSYYVREDKEKEKHIFEGFSSIAELPKFAQEDFEKLLLARLVVLVNAVLTMTSAEIIEFLPTFLERVQKRLDGFFATGEFLITD